MADPDTQTELYHDIFGSILDRDAMSPYLLRQAMDHSTALRQATKMLGNRGFDISGTPHLRPSEQSRAQFYIRQVRRYFAHSLFPFLMDQLQKLIALQSPQEKFYRHACAAIVELDKTLRDKDFKFLVSEDPRHLLLLASLRKYPHLFEGYRVISPQERGPWQRMACAILKMAHLIKSLEEDSQEIHQYTQLGLYLESSGFGLMDLYRFDFSNPNALPKTDAAQLAFVKLSTFFCKLRESLTFHKSRQCHVFNSGDGVEVDIVDIKARLKSPESMLAKLGKDVEGEVHDIRDILAITFLLRDKHDTLTLFHALQKRGVILQENTVSHSITQTLFKSPTDMVEAVRRLMQALAKSEGRRARPSKASLMKNSRAFYQALSIMAKSNIHSSLGHRKFQCKIQFSLPIHRTQKNHTILIPGTALYADRDNRPLVTEQHTLPVELRISDVQSWVASEQKGDAHHEAYKFRQLIALANRLFRPAFQFPSAKVAELRKDQARLYR